MRCVLWLVACGLWLVCYVLRAMCCVLNVVCMCLFVWCVYVHEGTCAHVVCISVTSLSACVSTCIWCTCRVVSQLHLSLCLPCRLPPHSSTPSHHHAFSYFNFQTPPTARLTASAASEMELYSASSSVLFFNSSSLLEYLNHMAQQKKNENRKENHNNRS